MAELTIKKGMNIRLIGAPRAEVESTATPEAVEVYPTEFQGVKPRLRVKEGDHVKRGTPLFVDKKNEAFSCCAPAQGTVETIEYGARRVVQRIRIKVSGDEAEPFTSYDLAGIKKVSREDALAQLLASGYLSFIRQRPFSRMADAKAMPKSIFVNAMSTAPFETDIAVALQGQEAAFQLGLSLLSRLTDGRVHLVLPGDRADLPTALTGAEGAEIHRVSGKHPAGNSSVHIHMLDPINPGDVVWTVQATDLIQIGRLFLDGSLPPDRVVSLGGPAVKEAARKHYQVRVGAPLDVVLGGHLVDGTNRLINGNVLAGIQLKSGSHLPFHVRGLTAIREDKSRHFMGWLAPGQNRYSLSPLFVSTWLNRGGTWDLGTNANGGLRAMVLTGLYDKYHAHEHHGRLPGARRPGQRHGRGHQARHPGNRSRGFRPVLVCLPLQDGPGRTSSARAWTESRRKGI